MPVFERLQMPSLGGASEWLGSEPLGPAELRGHVVGRELLDLDVHQLVAPGAVRARLGAGLRQRRAGRHRNPHAEFSFEHDIDGVRRAIEERAIDYAVAVDNDYAVWSAFANHSWPALYFVDTDGVIRDHHFGEGRYGQSERVIQRLLGVDREPVSVEAVGVEAPADWDHLHTPETYLGYARGDRAGHWAVAGEWTIAAEALVLDAAGGSLTCRFHARDAHLVLSRRARQPIAYRVLLDGEPPGPSHGVDIDEHGTGVLRDARMYQLVPQHDAIRDRTLQITFLEPGAEAYDAHSASRRWRPASWRAHRAPSPSGRRPDRSRQESIHPGARPVTHGRDRRPVAKPLRRCPKGLESEARCAPTMT